MTGIHCRFFFCHFLQCGFLFAFPDKPVFQKKKKKKKKDGEDSERKQFALRLEARKKQAQLLLCNPGKNGNNKNVYVTSFAAVIVLITRNSAVPAVE